MQVIEGQNWIEYSELAKIISKNTINAGLFDNRNKKSQSWQHKKEGRKVLIAIDSIPEATRLKLPKPSKAALKSKSEIVLTEVQQELQIKERNENAIYTLGEALLNYEPYLPIYLKKGTINFDTARLYAKTHSVFSKCLELKKSGITKRLIFQYYTALQIKNSISHEQSFYRKLRLAETDLQSAIIHKLKGNTNHEKTTPYHIAQTEHYASHPKKYSSKLITSLLNYDCEKIGLTSVSISWVKALLAKAEVQNRIANKRHGAKYANDNVMPYTPRTNAFYAGDQWQMDGTPLQIHCWDEKRENLIRLNMFLLKDAYSGKIVGFDLSLSEDRFNIINAFHRAVSLCGHLPKEVLHDNFSANKTDEIKALKAKMERMGVMFRAAKVHNAQDKTKIERGFETFESEIQSLLDGYVGQGITSKRKNARRDGDYLQKVKNAKGYYDINTMQAHVIQLIDIFNCETVLRQQSRSDKYNASEKPNIVKLNPEDIALLFYNETKYRVNRSMVKITIQKQNYFYNIYDHNDKLKLNGTTVRIRYDESDLSRIHLFNMANDNFICECRLMKEPAMVQINQTDADVLEIQKQASHNKAFVNHRDNQKKEITKKALVQTGLSELCNTDPLALFKENVNSLESSQLQEMLAMSEVDMNRVQLYRPVAVNTGYNDYNEAEDLSKGKYDKMGKGSLKPITKIAD